VENIDHTLTRARSPQTNGICKRFHKTMLNEFYRVAFRKKIYTSLDELRGDLDAWLAEYNETRPHQGRWCYGKTPMQTFLDSVPSAKEKLLVAGDSDVHSDTETAEHGLSDRVPAFTRDRLVRTAVSAPASARDARRVQRMNSWRKDNQALSGQQRRIGLTFCKDLFRSREDDVAQRPAARPLTQHVGIASTYRS
jgi:Integrase core domain